MQIKINLNKSKNIRVKDLLLIIILYSYILLTNIKINNMILKVDNNIRILSFILIIYFSLNYIFSRIFSRYYLKLELLVIFYTIYEVFLLVIGNKVYTSKEEIFYILYFPIMFLAGRFVFFKVVFNEKILEVMSFILLLIFSSCFIFNKVIYGFVGGVNTIYYQICILPICIRSKSKVFRYMSILISTFCIFFSGKRTAFLMWGVIILLFLFINFDFKKYSWNKKIFIFIFILINIFFIDRYITLKYGVSVFKRLLQLTSDGGSGRSDLLKLFFYDLKQSTFFEILFGHNMMSTASFTDGIGVHNDFLEVFYRCGLIGLMIIFEIMRRVFKYILKTKAISYRYYYCFLCEFIIIILFMLFSQIIYLTSYNCIFLFEIALLISINKGETILNE